MTTQEDVEARLDDISKQIKAHLDAVTQLTQEYYDLMNMLRTRFGL